jgi:hypothetical protein
MVRTQIQLTEEQASALRALAAQRGVSFAELVRTAVQALLRRETMPDDAERRRRALNAFEHFASGHADVSRRHDEHLVDAYRT